jgi:hypothetical protein
MRRHAPADDLFICIAQNKVNQNVATQYQWGAWTMLNQQVTAGR